MFSGQYLNFNSKNSVSHKINDKISELLKTLAQRIRKSVNND